MRKTLYTVISTIYFHFYMDQKTICALETDAYVIAARGGGVLTL